MSEVGVDRGIRVPSGLEADVAAVPEALVGRIAGAHAILAVSHENPDGDTLGAALGLAAIARALGTPATALCTDPVPGLYGFMRGIERFRTDPDPAIPYDLVVLVDCADLSRVGEVRGRHAALFEALPVISIDHHRSNSPGIGDWVDPESAATCEMVALLALRMGVALDADDGELASVLLAGVVMDTATFQHPSTTPRTLRVAAALLGEGAPLSDISRLLYRTKPEAQLRLFGRVLDRISTTPDGLVVWSDLRGSDLVETGTGPEHSEGIIDLLAQAAEAEVALLFKEGDAETRLSIRTRDGGVDATRLAGAYGGGGHARASGATIALPLAEAVAPAVAEAQRLALEVRR